MAHPVVTLLTDYGLDDPFAGICRGVIKRIAPDAEVLDITHGIAPQQVLQGALVLAEALPYMPVGVHVGIVDPGVGGRRRPLAVRSGDGRIHVGPDNGLLLIAADRLGGVAEAVEITSTAVLVRPISATFHGRDVFAPAAGHLAKGVPLAALGRSLDPAELVRVEVPQARVERGLVQATILSVDRFGNLRLAANTDSLAAAGIPREGGVEIEAASRTYRAVAARTFADVRAGAMLLYEDSSGGLALAVNRGDAARLLAVMAGQDVSIRAEPA